MEIHKRENYDMDFIQSLISNGIEESINIDFKAAEALSKVDAKKKEISKDVSAFANSDGGIIVYGLNENNHKADSLSFIDGNEFSKEWLEQVISSTIQRNIPNLKIFPIRNKGKINETIYVVQIPESFDAPHICKDKKFYKRYNFESVAMEEYEVRNLYGRKNKANLILSGYNLSFINIEDGFAKFTCVTGVLNDGNIEESKYKVNVYFENFYSKNMKIYWDHIGDGINYSYTILEEGRIKISNNGKSTIFPNEKIDLLRFNFDIKLNNIEDVINNLKIGFRLYYSGGEDNIETDLKKLFIDIKSKI